MFEKAVYSLNYLNIPASKERDASSIKASSFLYFFSCV